MSVGLLLLRAYAVADHRRRLVLAVLGFLGVCTISMNLVSTHVISVTGMVIDTYDRQVQFWTVVT